ncbi:MAG: GntP family permease [Bryobacteraceae bacterium]|nr:GntP family permease [Bryobacteraceae bacterium]
MVEGPALLVLTLGAVVLLLLLILVFKLHAFLSLLLVSMALGLGSGMAPSRVLKSIQAGFGDALGFIAVVVALGSVIGRLLEHSGGGRALAQWLLEKTGERHAVWAVFFAAFLIGLPIFFEVGFIILVPFVYSLARQSGKSLLYFGLPVAAALTVTHAMVPPHPAPAAAAQLLGADMGKAILYGVALSIPMALIGGMGYGVWIARRIFVPVPEAGAAAPQPEGGRAPHPLLVALLLVLPVLLIFAASIAESARPPALAAWQFFGHPFTALMLAALGAIFLFGLRRGLNRDAVQRLAEEALKPLGSLLAIIGGGGAFKQIIVDSGAGTYAGRLLADSAISPLLVAYLVAFALRVAQGSATVAIITAGGIVAPLVRGLNGYTPEILLLALCAGGTALSHVNDAGFWLVNQCLGLSVADTLRTWTVMKVITSAVGILCVFAVQWLLG